MYELFPYQFKGALWLIEEKVRLLADEMGLGKSAQAIAGCDLINAERILVLCPASARINWIREFEKFSLQSRKFDLIQTRSQKPQSKSIICSYDLAPELLRNTDQSFDCLILDESHFLKSLDTKRTRAVYGRDGFVRRTERVWAISGTPAPNHFGELWPLLFTFGATALLYDAFVERYCTFVNTVHGRQITGANRRNLGELQHILQGIMLRRRKEDVMSDLPEIFYNDIAVEAGLVDLEIESSFIQYVFPTDRRSELTEKLVKEQALVESMVSAAGLGKDGMRALEALAGSVSTLRRYTGLQKVQNTAALILEELESNAYEKIVIFAIHRDVIEGLRVRLRKFKPVTLYGGTDPETRQKNIDKFQKNPRCRVFIGNIQAAGTAITLTAAHHVLFIEQDWVPGNNAQAAMRCHRIGQTKTVNVRFVALANSIDERIAQVLKRKTRDLTELFDDNSVAVL